MGVITLLGKTKDQTNIFLSIIWLAQKKGHDPLVEQMLTIAREKTIQQLLQEARQAVQGRE